MTITSQITQADPLRSLTRPHRLISLGFYDGTTNGLIQFEGTPYAFKYDLVSWDAGEDWRVFCLASLAPNDFEKAVEVLSVLGEPKWPCWYPIWKFASDSQKHDTEHSLEAILSSSGPYVNAVLSIDLCASIRAAITIEGESKDMAREFFRTRARQPFENWIRLFGTTVSK